MKNVLRQSYITLATMLVTVPALAEDGAAGGNRGLYAIGAALAIGVAAMGGALGQGKAVASALDGIARNPSAQPKIFTSMILGLALIESLVIFSLLIAFNLSGKA